MKYKFGFTLFVISMGTVMVAENNPKPNIILILADDMGFSDLGCFGSEIQTPNLDDLAKNGLRFTQFYNAARCCPTRASLLTGVHPHQAGMGHMAGGAFSLPETTSYQGYLNDNVVTIAQVLKTAGYYTAMAGKWHLGNKSTSLPQTRGFDHSYEGQGFYFLKDNGGLHKINIDGVATDISNTNDGKDWYSSLKWAEWGTKYINEAVKTGKPFFLYLPFNAPHFPLAAPDSVLKKYIGRYKNGWSELRKDRHLRQKNLGIIDDSYLLTPDDTNFKSWESLSDIQKAEQDSIMATYAACVDLMDQSIGRVLDSLKIRGILDNTLIVFLSDNGGNAEGPIDGLGKNAGPGYIGSALSDLHCGGGWANAQNTPFKEYKHYIHEGGIHTSFIVHWPAGIQSKGELRKQPGPLIDIMPTFVEAAGADYPRSISGNSIIPMQGVSLFPAFKNQSLNRDTLCWEHEANRGIRIGDMKCVAKVSPVRVFTQADHSKWELYDLSKDPTEMNNLASLMPEIVNEMIQEWEKWANKKSVIPWPWGNLSPLEPQKKQVVFHFELEGNLKDCGENNILLENPHENTNFFSVDSAGKYGKALALSGEYGTYLQIPQVGLLDPSVSDYTVCAWVKNKSANDHVSEHIILHQAINGNGSTRFVLACNGSGKTTSENLQISTFMGGNLNKSVGYVPRNEWTHIAITGSHENSTLKFYINGKLDNTAVSSAFESSTQGYFLGKHRADSEAKNVANWVGLIDDLYMFNYALSIDELQKVMKNENTTSSEKNYAQKISVFPNPFSEFITTNNPNCTKMELYSLSGKKIKEVSSNKMNASSLGFGIYCLKVYSENKIYSIPVFKH